MKTPPLRPSPDRGRRYFGLGIVILTVTAASSLLNFLYGVLAARSLGVFAFSAYASLVVITGVLVTAAGSFQAITAREVARSSPASGSRDPWLIKVTLVSIVVMMILLLAAPAFASWFAVGTGDLIPVAMTAPAAALFAVATGRLIGRESLYSWQIAGGAATGLKFVLGLVMYAWWASVAGFLWGPAIAAAIVAAFILWKTRWSSLSQVRLTDRSVLTTGGVVILLWLAVHIDIIAARINLPPGESGAYSAAASLTKSLIVLLALAGTVVLPRISRSFDEKTFPRHLAGLLAAVLLLLSVLLSLVFTYTGADIIRVLFGQDFYLGNNLLALSMWISVPWVIAAGLLNAWMGSRHLGAVLLGLLIILLLEISLMTRLGSNLESIMTIFGLTGVATVIVALIPFARPSFIQEPTSRTPGTGVL